MRLFRRRPSALLGLALAGALVGCESAAPPGGDTVHLRIENGGAGPIRCQAILAHFVTRSLPAIPGGGAHHVTLLRDRGTGSLSYGAHGGRAMMLENILCGDDGAWTASARDLPLQRLRSVPSSRFTYRCALEAGRMACVPS